MVARQGGLYATPMRVDLHLKPRSAAPLRAEAQRQLRLALSRYATRLARVRLVADATTSADVCVDVSATLVGGPEVTLTDRDPDARADLARACGRLARLVSVSLDAARLERASSN